MLKLATDAAECFLADTQVSGNQTKRNPFEDMWCLVYEVFVAFFCRFKLCIHISFFQPDIIFFIHNSYKSFYIVILIKKVS